MSRVFEIISDALATSTSRRTDQRIVKAYTAIFERALAIRAKFSTIDHIYTPNTVLKAVRSWSLAIKDLVTLLLCLEHRIRDPTTNPTDREWQRQYRQTCIEKYISSLNAERSFITQGPISYVGCSG